MDPAHFIAKTLALSAGAAGKRHVAANASETGWYFGPDLEVSGAFTLIVIAEGTDQGKAKASAVRRMRAVKLAAGNNRRLQLQIVRKNVQPVDWPSPSTAVMGLRGQIHVVTLTALVQVDGVIPDNALKRPCVEY